MTAPLRSPSRRALLLGRPAEPLPVPGKAGLVGRCLEAEGVACRLCDDACEAGAIGFRLLGRGRARIVIAADRCTGCGACVAACPVDALAVPMEAADG